MTGPDGVALSDSTLSSVPDSVPVPAYDRSAVTPGIAHIGVGGFHRAHQAMYVDRLLAEGVTDWGIVGIGLLPGDRRMKEVLSAQDGLYTLVQKHSDGRYEAQVIGSILDYLLLADDRAQIMDLLTAPTTRIVSLTVTEGGYNFHHVTGEFVADEPGVVHDLTDGNDPRTVFGLVVEALDQRRRKDIAPFTVMSCDNIAGNGDVARRMFGAYAHLKDADLAGWIQERVPFPNCMVDRITPVTTDADRTEIAERFGIIDGWPVVCEPFTQWVLEDSFTDGRPPYEDAGVQLVDDVVPYELMKLRLLNSGHQTLCYFGHLSGYTYAHEASQDLLIVDLLQKYMAHEGVPTVPDVPGIDLRAYCAELIERFANPNIRDTIARLCAESSDRIPKWLLPVVRENLAHGGEVTRSAAVVASWARYAEGTDEQGAPIEIVDRLADRLHASALQQRVDPLAFLRDREVFGDIVDDERFTTPYLQALESLHDRGAQATLRRLAGTD